MSEMIINMYVVAVESGRISIDFVPIVYRKQVKIILGIEV